MNIFNIMAMLSESTIKTMANMHELLKYGSSLKISNAFPRMNVFANKKMYFIASNIRIGSTHDSART